MNILLLIILVDNISTYEIINIKNSISQKNALVNLQQDNNSNVQGYIHLSQGSYFQPTIITGNIKNLQPNKLMGFHIHQYGDLTNGCSSAGGHYNPFNSTHGSAFGFPRHVGDFGNIKSDENGNANFVIKSPNLSLYGDYTVIGRAIVVHQNQDDLGKGNNEDSLKTGNAGPRIACGVIGITNQTLNDLKQ